MTSQFPPLPSAAIGLAGRIAKRPNASAHYAGVVKIKRSIAAVKKAGIDCAVVDLLPDGTIRLYDLRVAPNPADDRNPLDRLIDGTQG